VSVIGKYVADRLTPAQFLKQNNTERAESGEKKTTSTRQQAGALNPKMGKK
jgi:hypothetical protein